MRVNIKKISGGTQQFADTITNAAPLIVDVQRLRDALAQEVATGQLPPDVSEAVDAEVSQAEEEVTAVRPRRGRLTKILTNIAALTSGLGAATELTNSVDAVLQTISSLE